MTEADSRGFRDIFRFGLGHRTAVSQKLRQTNYTHKHTHALVFGMRGVSQ